MAYSHAANSRYRIKHGTGYDDLRYQHGPDVHRHRLASPDHRQSARSHSLAGNLEVRTVNIFATREYLSNIFTVARDQKFSVPFSIPLKTLSKRCTDLLKYNLGNTTFISISPKKSPTTLESPP